MNGHSDVVIILDNHTVILFENGLKFACQLISGIRKTERNDLTKKKERKKNSFQSKYIQ